MSAKPESRWWYVAKREAIDNEPAAAAMDMLRYDGARVECNAPTGFYLLSKSANFGEPCAPRWASFGIKIYIISKGQQPPWKEEIERCVKQEDELYAKRAKA